MMTEKINSLQKGVVTSSPPKDVKVKENKASTKTTERVTNKDIKFSSEIKKRINAKEVAIEDVKQAVIKVEQKSSIMNTKLSFNIDESTDRLVVKVIDKETGETIRQIPSEEMLRLAEMLDEESKGALVNKTG